MGLRGRLRRKKTPSQIFREATERQEFDKAFLKESKVMARVRGRQAARRGTKTQRLVRGSGNVLGALVFGGSKKRPQASKRKRKRKKDPFEEFGGF